MGRNIGRVGGAVAGIVAIVFGILDVQDKVPQWLLILLGALAIAGVLLDYLWAQRADEHAEAASRRVRQRQRGGLKSRNYQAGRDIHLGVDSEKTESDR